jgi:predicted SAM-dependent methyltransferase
MPKLNVGSGPNYLDGWVNLDACDLFKRDYAVNLPDDKLSALFGKDYADEIFMSDVMEHFYRWDGIEVLKDFFAVLKPGGLMSIVTPDLEKIIVSKTMTLQRKTELIRGAQGQPGPQSSSLLMQAWKKHPKLFSHLYTWTEKELLGVLTDLGFRVRTTKWKADWEMVVSATKPG